MSNLVFHDSDEYINTYDIFDQVKPDVGVGVGTAKGIKYARLFSAAPDLLAALKLLLNAYENPSPLTDGSKGQQMRYCRDKARAAIALAGVTP